MHSHSRTTATPALSSAESEIMAISELLKECKLVQFNLEFAGFGTLPIVIRTDADAARAFVHRRGCGRMKHLDVRHCWLQAELKAGGYSCKRVDRSANAADVLTKPPSAAELQNFKASLGLYPLAVARGAFSLVKSLLKSTPQVQVSAALLALMPRGAAGVELKSSEAAGMSWFTLLVLFTVAFIATVSCLVGYVIGHAHKSTVEIKTEVAKEKLVYSTKVAKEGLMQPNRVFHTMQGECFHLDADCRALRSVKVVEKRPCRLCVMSSPKFD